MSEYQIGPETTSEQALETMFGLIRDNLKMTGLQHEAVKTHCYEKVKRDLIVYREMTENRQSREAQSDAS